MSVRKNKFLADKFEEYQDGSLTGPEKKVIDEWFDEKLNAEQPDFLADPAKANMLHQEMISHINEARVINPIASNLYPPAYRKTAGWLKVAASLLIISGLSYYGINMLYKEKPAVPVTYQAYNTPNGKVKKIMLQDGTEIWMNAATQIRVASDFATSKLRAIYLDKGEAFFHVKRDTLRPFSITTKNFVTTVLGTSFNIKSYPELNTYQVAVASGKVKVEEMTGGKLRLLSAGLIKDEVLNYSLKKNTYALSKENVTYIKHWKVDGLLYCENLNLVEIGAALSRQYNIPVRVIQQEKAQKKYTMKLNHEDLQKVLERVSLKTGMSYELTAQYLIINPNPQ